MADLETSNVTPTGVWNFASGLATNCFLSATTGVTASTTQSQGQGAITTHICQISTCANANDTVTLPAAAEGTFCLVINNGAQTAQVFPASGDNCGKGVNTATTVAAGHALLAYAYDATTYVSFDVTLTAA